MEYNRKQRCELLRAQMDTEAISFKPLWRDLSDLILPRRSRFFTSDVNRGDRRNLNIIDSTATLASRTFSSGMMTGVTSPSRPWFKYRAKSRELRNNPEVKAFFGKCEEIVRGKMLSSNVYKVLPHTYADFGTFATACIFMDEDLQTGATFNSFLVGSYRIALDHRGLVNVFSREFQMSVRQIVERFGMVDPDQPENINWENISLSIKDNWERGVTETMVDVVHVVKPNKKYSPSKAESKFKKYISLYYEIGSSAGRNSGSAINVSSITDDKFLSEKGYDYFPVLAPAWERAGEDTYGTGCPGMIALGDVKQLQFEEKRIAQAIDQKVKPSMVGPTSLKNTKTSMIPGHITYVDEVDGRKTIRRLFEMDFDVRELEVKQNQIRQRISRAYFEDLFLMMANTDRRQITAREIDEKHEEKLLALGPVLQNVDKDLLDPLVTNWFMILLKQGELPELPEVLEGAEFEIEYISIMAQAQKLAGIGGLERLLGFVANVSNMKPEALDKIDVDAAIDLYAEAIGTDPSLVIGKEEIENLRAQRAAAQQQEAEAVETAEMVQAGKTLSDTKMDENTALAELMGA